MYKQLEIILKIIVRNDIVVRIVLQQLEGRKVAHHMPRPKKAAPNRANGTYEYKATIGKTFDGKTIRKSFYSPISLEDAKRKAEEYKVKRAVVDTVGVTEETTSDISFSDWANKWLTVYKKPYVTDNTYRLTYENFVVKHIIPYFGNAKLKNIRSIDVQQFFDKKYTELSQSSLDKIHICLFGIFDKAIDNDLIVKNPVKNVVYKSTKDKNIKNVWSDEQIIIAKQFFADRLPEVVLLLDTGLRRGEMLGLMWSDIDFENKTLTIRRSIADKQGGGVDISPPKMESYRTIPIPQSLIDLLKELSRASEYVFPNQNGEVQLPHSFSKRLVNAMKEFHTLYSSIPILTAHELRHTRGTQLRRNGTDIYTIQKIMGHKDINVTANIYVHDEIEATRKAANIV